MNLLEYIDRSPSPFHAVKTLEEVLQQAGFHKLLENADWTLEASSSYYCIRQDASLIAFCTPSDPNNKPFQIIGAHTDSPCLKLKSNPQIHQENYHIANVEVYGGVLWNSWLDRDLDLAGIVYFKENNELHSKLINIDLSARIPQLAIHLDRGVNEKGLQLDPQKHLRPLLGHNQDILESIQNSLPPKSTILSWDLSFHDKQGSSLGGSNQEWIYAPRLDNLAMVHSATEAIIDTEASESIQVAAFFNHEEVGSTSAEGADSNFLPQVLERIHTSFSQNNHISTRLQSSRFLSADMAHAIHPNYPDRHDEHHKPLMGKGPVLKTNVNMRYATNAEGSAYLKDLCLTHNIPLQDFQGHNGISCGSTIGPMSAARLGVNTLDIGNPMLSMHSAREMANIHDHEKMILLMKKWYA